MPRTLILIENTTFPSDPRVLPQTRSLTAAGWDVVVLCPTGRTDEEKPAEVLDGVEVYRFPRPESTGSAVGYAREYSSALISMWRDVRRLARTQSFDVVQACTPPDVLLLAARGLRRHGASMILDHHDLSPELFEAKYNRRGPFYRSLLLAERSGFFMADVVISPNESYKRIAIDRGHKSQDQVFVVRNGPDPEVFRPVAPDERLRRDKEFLLGYVGVMGSQDGLADAIYALAELQRRRSDWRAIFVGSGDAAQDALRLVVGLGLQEEVEFLGHISDRERLVQLIASCDVCLSPEPRNRLNEQSTLIKVAEYMAVGRPVVAYSLPETRVTAGEAAAFADRDEPAALAEEIDRLLRDAPLRATMGAVGRRRVEELLGWPHSEQQLLEAYESALRRRNPNP